MFMTEEQFLAWAVDIEWAFRKLKWGYAITCALLVLVLTGGCACLPQIGMAGVGVAATVVTLDPGHAIQHGIEATACVVHEARQP